MFDLSCPKCGSSRIHRGYDETPLYKRVFGLQNLLCNRCNLLFTGFAWPGTVQRHSRRKRKQEEQPVVHAGLVERKTALELAQELRAQRDAEPVATRQVSVPVRTEAPDALETPVPRGMAAIAATLAETANPPVQTFAPSRTIPAKNREAARAVEPADDTTSADDQEDEFTSASESTSRRRKKKTPTEQHQPGLWDYARFGTYYAGLWLKAKTGLRPASHSLELKFRWRNWWHWQRAKKD